MGPRLDEFERRMAAYHERRFGVAVNSGTSALHLAMLAMNLQPGDEVITTPFSFIASTNCILYVDAVPRFVDIEPDTWNLDPTQLAGVASGRTRGILPVHVFGLPCDMKAVTEFARERDLWVVEDACEAIGAYDREGLVGRAADATVLAFYPNKQMTTGEGGMLLTNDERINSLCRSWRNQGRGESGAWLSHERLGYNYRMSDIAAALGIAQLGRIDELLSKRAQVAQWYDERLAGHPSLVGQAIPAGMRKSWFVYVLKLDDSCSRQDREAVLDELRRQGIGCSNYFSPIHLQPYIAERLGLQRGDFPVCERIADRTIALPLFGNLSEQKVEAVCKRLALALETVASRARPLFPARPPARPRESHVSDGA
jgi:perosamine synthetase